MLMMLRDLAEFIRYTVDIYPGTADYLGTLAAVRENKISRNIGVGSHKFQNLIS